jgi:hypothetical protein
MADARLGNDTRWHGNSGVNAEMGSLWSMSISPPTAVQYLFGGPIIACLVLMELDVVWSFKDQPSTNCTRYFCFTSVQKSGSLVNTVREATV